MRRLRFRRAAMGAALVALLGLSTVAPRAEAVFHPPGGHATSKRGAHSTHRKSRHGVRAPSRGGATARGIAPRSGRRLPPRAAGPHASAQRAAGSSVGTTGAAAPRPTISAAERAREQREWAAVASAQLPENAPVRDGAWLDAADLARLLDATKFWRSDLRKLELRTRGHRLALTVDNPFVIVDEHTVFLPAAVESRGGMLAVPVALVDSLPSDTTLVRLVYDAHRGLVLRVPALGLVRPPHIVDDGTTAHVTFTVDRPEDAVVIGRGRSHFRVRFGGFFVGSLPDSLPGGRLVRAIHPLPSTMGSAFELDIAPDAQGFQLAPDTHHGTMTLVIEREERKGYDRFAPEGPPGPRPVRVIVLDPGHGGADAGVTAGGAVEKTLTLELARTLARELTRRLGAHVVMTRVDDRVVTVEQRAERANRAHADLVLSLHFDGAPGPALRGVTAYCAPATEASGPEGAGNTSLLMVLPWRDVATRHAVRSRELAEAMLTSFELEGLGPARLREVLPYALLGVDAPGLMLECAVLTSDQDRARVTRQGGIDELASAIVTGVSAYARAR